MAGYRLSRAAEFDLVAIAEYGIETFGLEQTLAYRDHLLRAFEFLAQFPRAARLRTELRPPVRIHPCRSHIIVYREDDHGILILRIRHGREDWSND